MGYLLEFEIDELPRLQTNNFPSHWARSRDKKHWLDLVWIAIRQWKPVRSGIPKQPLMKAKLTFTRFSSREPDFTNQVASMKPVEDALVTLKIIHDDSPEIIGHPEYLWHKAKRGAGKIRVRVEGVDDE